MKKSIKKLSEKIYILSMANIKFKKVDHFAFLVSDMDKAIDFYQNTLGLKFLSREVDEEHGEEFSYFQLEGGDLELLKRLDREKGPINTPNFEERANSPHLAFTVEDFGEAIQKLKQKNVSFIGKPNEIENKVKWAYFSDPDNNIIEIVHWLNK